MAAHIQMPCTDDYCGGTCAACCLAWCKVCGAGEAELTTDCPGPSPRDTEEQRLAMEAKRKNVSDGLLDFIATIGWHAIGPGVSVRPRFAKDKAS